MLFYHVAKMHSNTDSTPRNLVACCEVKISVKKFVTLVNLFGKEKKVND